MGTHRIDGRNMMASSQPGFRPTLLGDLQFPTIQFNFNPHDLTNFPPPAPPNPQSFAYQNAEEAAGWRRRERVMSHCRKRRGNEASFTTTCTPSKQRRTNTKTHVSGASTLPADIPPPMPSRPILAPLVPMPGTSTQHQAPHDLLLNWQPFAANESCDIDMCNNEMQGLNIVPRMREPVVLTIDVTGYEPHQIKIDVSGGQLSVLGKKQESLPDKIIQHKFTRIYNFPGHFDATRLMPDFGVSGLLRIVCPYSEDYCGMFDGDIELEIMDSDRTVIKRDPESATKSDGLCHMQQL